MITGSRPRKTWNPCTSMEAVASAGNVPVAVLDDAGLTSDHIEHTPDYGEGVTPARREVRVVAYTRRSG